MGACGNRSLIHKIYNCSVIHIAISISYKKTHLIIIIHIICNFSCRSWYLPFYIGLIASFVILYILNWIVFVLVMISIGKHSYKKIGSTVKEDTFTLILFEKML